MKDPLVSVSVIAYNHVPFIFQAIEGVVGQKTDFPFELVIGEDCSTDGTRKSSWNIMGNIRISSGSSRRRRMWE